MDVRIAESGPLSNQMQTFERRFLKLFHHQPTFPWTIGSSLNIYHTQVVKGYVTDDVKSQHNKTKFC